MSTTEGRAPERDKIILIGERHYPFTVLLRHREQILQNITYPLAQLRAKILENEVWVLLGDCGRFIGGDVVSEVHVVEGEVDGGAVREMRNDHRV